MIALDNIGKEKISQDEITREDKKKSLQEKRSSS